MKMRRRLEMSYEQIIRRIAVATMLILAVTTYSGRAGQSQKAEGAGPDGKPLAAGNLAPSFTCDPVTLPRDRQGEAARNAVAENPENKLSRRGGGQDLPLGAVDE